MRFKIGDTVTVKSFTSLKNYLNLTCDKFSLDYDGTVRSRSGIVINGYMQKGSTIEVRGTHSGQYDYVCDDDWAYCDWMLI
jgi:hypothetical protein